MCEGKEPKLHGDGPSAGRADTCEGEPASPKTRAAVIKSIDLNMQHGPVTVFSARLLPSRGAATSEAHTG